MDAISVKAPHRRGRPRKFPRGSTQTRITTPSPRPVVSPEETHPCEHPERSKKKRVGKPTIFDKQALKKTRHTMERFFSWIKSFRRIDTRYDMSADAFMGFVRLGCILILMREVVMR